MENLTSNMTSGMNYYYHRYYKTETGRFLNEDPIGLNGGFNLYGFVGNNSINTKDLYGLHGFVFCGRVPPFVRLSRIWRNMPRPSGKSNFPKNMGKANRTTSGSRLNKFPKYEDIRLDSPISKNAAYWRALGKLMENWLFEYFSFLNENENKCEKKDNTDIWCIEI